MAIFAFLLLIFAWLSVYQVTAKENQFPATVVIHSGLTGTDVVDVGCIREPLDERVLPNKRIDSGDEVQWSFSTQIVDSSYIVCNFHLLSVHEEASANIKVWLGPTNQDELCGTFGMFRFTCNDCTWVVKRDALYVRDALSGLLYPCRKWT